VVRPFCSSERSDKCKTAVSLLCLIIHLVDALGRRAYGREGYGFSIAGNEHGRLAIGFNAVANLHAIPEVRSNRRGEFRDALTTGNRHPRRRHDPAIRVGDMSAANNSSNAAVAPF
jgi:hypothetical protein